MKNTEGKKTLVLGASENPSRYSNMAMKKLALYGHSVVAIGNRKGAVNGVEISTEKADINDVDTVTLYLNPTNQQPYTDYILGLHPKRIIFNPGTENDALIKAAEEQGIEPVIGCTLVMLSVGSY